MSAMVGNAYWGAEDKKYHHMLDKMDVGGKMVARCPAKSEAMGRVIYSNCHEKWEIIILQMAHDSDWRVPTYSKNDSDTHKWHKTKWSEAHSGKVEGAGWQPGAYTAFNEAVKDIINFRAEDKKQGFKMIKFCKKVVRAKYKVVEKVATGKRKRKSDKPEKERKLRPWWNS